MKKLGLLIMPLMAISFLTNCNNQNSSETTYHIVNFDTDGGSFITAQKVEEGKTAKKPDDPSKENYCFTGWLLNNKVYDFNTPITEDVTLVANWDFGIYDDECEYLTFNALEDSTVSYIIHRTLDIDIEYSTDMEQWTDLGPNEIYELKKGKKIYLRNTKDYLSQFDAYGIRFVQFSLTGKIAASGKITLSKDCEDEYYHLFDGCEALVRAPAFPHLAVLPTGCYRSMFENCHNLEKGPLEISGDGIGQYSFDSMFKNCFKLERAPELPIPKIMQMLPYTSMFEGCHNLKEPPSILPSVTLADNCYENMFRDCFSLRRAPILPAPTSSICYKCYEGMFTNCFSLSELKVGFDSSIWDNVNQTDDWLENTGLNVKDPTFIWKGGKEPIRDDSHVPENWIIKTEE